ncbi:hypothetical protein LTR62_001134 [Meristemomyces frigidus]|uniref:Uncharacterized protein n=1 Tax=Meristemomyces frigidus TaxID=1508187 RepID=A0AAN7TM02_9PEZI|nr:hypothetical protein LTR62_001134 [Meristemomyces frigidus]
MEDGKELSFRASKRRKVFRKRVEDDDVEGAASDQPASQDDQPGRDATKSVQKPVVKKQGIVFSNMDQTRSTEARDTDNEETVTMAIQPSREVNVLPGADRFMKPTGKTEVVDDRHMTAFVDSKLAEMRAASAIITPNHNESIEDIDHSDEAMQTSVPSNATASKSVTQRRRNERRPPRRRQPRPTDPNETARASFIDDIMKESTLPHYDHAGHEVLTESKVDNEDTAAEAFKAQYLQEVEARRRKRQPAPPPFSKATQAKGAERTSHGPKLGGSRSQREKMKAARAAAENETVKK